MYLLIYCHRGKKNKINIFFWLSPGSYLGRLLTSRQKRKNDFPKQLFCDFDLFYNHSVRSHHCKGNPLDCFIYGNWTSLAVDKWNIHYFYFRIIFNPNKVFSCSVKICFANWQEIFLWILLWTASFVDPLRSNLATLMVNRRSHQPHHDISCLLRT